MTSQTLSLSTIKPASLSALFVEIPQRSKEGEEKKPSLFVEFSLPEAINSIQNPEIKAFCIASYSEAVLQAAREAKKEGLDSFKMLSLSELFKKTGKREFLLTKKDLSAWLSEFAVGIISAAIATKANLHIDSPKVVKKALKYSELILSLSSRSLMDQESIDNCLRVLTLITESGKEHTYTDNVVSGIARAQAKLDAFIKNGSQDDDDDDIDF